MAIVRVGTQLQSDAPPDTLQWHLDNAQIPQGQGVGDQDATNASIDDFSSGRLSTTNVDRQGSSRQIVANFQRAGVTDPNVTVQQAANLPGFKPEDGFLESFAQAAVPLAALAAGGLAAFGGVGAGAAGGGAATGTGAGLSAELAAGAPLAGGTAASGAALSGGAAGGGALGGGITAGGGALGGGSVGGGALGGGITAGGTGAASGATGGILGALNTPGAATVAGGLLGLLSSGGDGNTTSVQRNEPPAFAVPFLQRGLTEAENILNQGFPTDTQALLRARGLAGSPVTNAAQDFATSTLRGDSLNSNPFLNDAIKDTLGLVRSQINSQFAGQGGNNFGSTAQQEFLGRGLTAAALPFQFQNFENERGQAVPGACPSSIACRY